MRFRWTPLGFVRAALLLEALLFCPPSHAAWIGDANLDGKVNVEDAVSLLRTFAQHAEPTPMQLAMADTYPYGNVNSKSGMEKFGDHLLGMKDVIALLEYALGILPPRQREPTVFTIGGTGPSALVDTSQTRNGRADQIPLFAPYDLNFDGKGNLYFTEEFAHRVRMMDVDGIVHPVAGGLDKGYADGKPWLARFNRPEGIALLPNGNLVVADTFNHAIRQVTPKGDVTTIAGNGKHGYADGPGPVAQFYEPNGVATDPEGNIYVADTGNNCIRKITPDGTVTTLSGSLKRGSDDGLAFEAEFTTPSGVLFDPRDGGLFIADMGNATVRKLSADGEVTTIAGQARVYGHVDGPLGYNQFRRPYGMDLDSEGRLWIVDWGNESLRVLLPNGVLKTFSGHLPQGYQDGDLATARYRGLMNVRVNSAGYLYLADTDNQRLRIAVP